MELMAWCQTFGVSRTTAWNWRRSGRLKVIYRYGRAYVPAEEIRRLSRTAA
jgi:predicted site-specific integrase-resolvase